MNFIQSLNASMSGCRSSFCWSRGFYRWRRGTSEFSLDLIETLMVVFYGAENVVVGDVSWSRALYSHLRGSLAISHD